ncbi:general substrate transporter [Syncephalastrum racemosum]|uniref:General substrate transporter n=1 Tax=Syncephalastrum racemosum TaxID=13706 RepID=A0A1X2HJ39_SYNRA|nr:general substrate transporter [Syncephalastrum racemosum]
MPTFATHFHMQGDVNYQAQVKGDIVSMLQAGCCVGGLLINVIGDPFGRKIAILAAASIFVVGSIIQVIAPSVGAMMAGRFLGGMGVGACSNIAPVYIAEISPKEWRGRLNNLYQFLVVIGIMVSYWIDYGCLKNLSVSDTQWRIPLGLQIVPGGILIICVLLLPESLRWLAVRDRLDDLKRTISRLRDLPEDHPSVLAEMDEIHSAVLEERAIKSSKWSEVCQKSNLRRLIIGVTIGICQQWTGTNAINYYAPDLFKQIGFTGDSVDILATGIYGIIKVVVVFAFFFMVDHPYLGRRNSLIIGTSIMLVGFFIIGGMIKIIEDTPGTTGGPAYAAMVMLYIYAIGYEMSWGPLVFVICAEIYPTRIRAICMSISIAVFWAMNAVIAKVVPLMMANLTYGTYFFFGSMLFLILCFTILFVPETRARSLEDMEPVVCY